MDTILLSEETPVIQTSQKFRRLRQYVAAIIATLSAFAAGNALGWTSPILNEITHGKFHNISVDTNDLGWIGSLITIGAFVSSSSAGLICDLIGPRKLLLLLIVPFSCGWISILIARKVFLLELGRFFIGVAIGVCSVAGPLYVSDIAHKNLRGTLGSFFQLMVTLGILYSYVVGSVIGSVYIYSIFCAIVPVIFFFSFVFQPESPVYCLKRGKYEEAKVIITKLRGKDYNADDELILLESSIKESQETPFKFRGNIAFQKALLISLMLMFFQQFSGVNVLILYSTELFNQSNSNLTCIYVAIVLVVGTILSIFVIDRAGRKPLLYFSCLLSAISTFLLGFYFTLKLRNYVSEETVCSLSFLPVVASCMFMFFFSIGLGPIPWMISTEIFPVNVKNVATASASTFNWIMAFLITKYVFQLQQVVGIDMVFFGFTAISLFGALFVQFIVPETKGKTYPEVQAELESATLA